MNTNFDKNNNEPIHINKNTIHLKDDFNNNIKITKIKKHIKTSSSIPINLPTDSNNPNLDIQSFIKYITEKMNLYEENITSSYLNIKNKINKLEEEFPQIELESFSEFFSIYEETYNLIQHSKIIITKSEELSKLNETMQIKINKLKSEKISLKADNDNLKEESKFKDEQILKLEEDLNNINSEYIELNQKFENNLNSEKINKSDIPKDKNKFSIEKNKFNSSSPNRHNSPYRRVSDKNNIAILIKENSILLKNLEKFENDLKLKYILKSESDKIKLRLEMEKNGLVSKLKICEVNLEKFRNENKNLKGSHDELKKELDKSEKKLEEISQNEAWLINSNRTNFRDTGSINFNNNFEKHTETPLNFTLDENDENFENVIRKTFSKLKTEINSQNNNKHTGNKKNISIITSSKEVSEFDFKSPKNNLDIKNSGITLKSNSQNNNKNLPIHFIIPESENENKNSNRTSDTLLMYEAANGKTILKDISDDEFENDKNNNNSLLNITSNEIVNKMSKNDFTNIKENTQQNNTINKKLILNDISEKIKSVKDLRQNYNDDSYKEFFMLTFKSIKLNSKNIEPFTNLTPEKLFKIINDNKIPFHKFYDFIIGEIKKYDEKLNQRNNYNKDKFQTVVNFISSRLF